MQNQVLRDRCRRAMQGSEEAIQALGLRDISLSPPSTVHLDKTSLQVEYIENVTKAIAAQKLGMQTLEMQCLDTIKYIKAIAKAKGYELTNKGQAEDVAEIMLAFLDEEESRFGKPTAQEKSESDEEKGSKLDEGPKPSAVSTNVSGKSSEEVKSQPQTTSKEIVVPVAEADGENVAEVELLVLDEEESRVAKPTAQEESQSNKSPPQTSCKESYAARSHNKRRQCPDCSYFGTHLARHIKMKHLGTRSDKEIAVLVAETDGKLPREQKHNPNVQSYQCGIGSCTMVVTRKGQHIKRHHKIFDAVEAKKAAQTFIKLTSPGTKRAATPKSLAGQPKKKKLKPPPLKTKPSKIKKVETEKPEKTVAKKVHFQKSDSESSEESDILPELEDDSEEDGKAEVDRGYLHIEGDFDEMSSFAESDEETLAEEDDSKWQNFYMRSDERKSTRQHFVSAFYRYLLHVEGGGHSLEQAMIHTRQVHNLMDTIDEKGDDVRCLVRNDGMDIWDVFCAPRLKNKVLTGNTIKTYLRSLELFAIFIKKGFFYKKALLPDTHRIAIVGLIERLPDYRSTVHRRTAQQHLTRKVDMSYERMTPADLRALENSDVVRDCIKTLGRAVDNHIPPRNDFTNVRDYLLVKTLYENGSRPGPLENAKVKRFKQATKTANNRWVILVDEHKTSRHYGPAELVVDDCLHSYLDIYVKYIRSAYVDDDEDALFVKDDGTQFHKGTIGRRVPELFKKAGIRKDINVSATRIRQIYSTEAEQMSPKKKKAINSHMKHQPKTASRNYVIPINAEKASKTHELMQSCIKREELKKTEEELEKSDSDREHSRTEPVNEKVYDQPPQQEQDDDSSQIAETPGRGLTSEEKSVIMTVYERDIYSGRELTVAEVRNRMRSDLFLHKFVINKEKVKKMYDYIRHRTNVVRQTTDITEQDEFQFEASISSTQRRAWQSHDCESIENVFKTTKTMPHKRIVVAIFQENDVLKHIMSREGKDRCYEKVKNIFKKRGAT